MSKTTYARIDSEVKYGDIAILPSGKAYREKYRIGYGANGRIYRIKKRGEKYEAKCQDTTVPMKDFLLITNTLAQMDAKLDEVGK